MAASLCKDANLIEEKRMKI